MSGPVLPGAALGVFGSGQLGRMFAFAARRMGYRVHVFSPESRTPAGTVSDRESVAEYDDLDAVAEFAQGVSVVTFEFENVPAATAAAAARFVPVRPGGQVLHVAQHRIREKQTLAAHGLPVTPFAPVRNVDDLRAALASLGAPAVLKTAAFGYDGKGQTVVRPADDPTEVWRRFGAEAVLEAFVDFDLEVSVVAVRSVDGAFAAYGPIANTHANHILDVSVFPAPVPDRVQRESVEIARAVCEALDVVGVLCVEFFLTRDGRLLINEIAPRPHNSGHLTIEGHATSQFEQQVRTVCGFPPGSTRSHGPVAMANLLGDLWQSGPPRWAAACADPDVQLHLYGKESAKPGRKMGHLTALAATPEEAAARVVAARAALVAR